jgi:arginine/lysine/ornithine decarboxylase
MEEAVGKISVEYIYLYPPGIPILAPGELINVETVNLVNEYRNRGLEVQGLEDEKCDKIHVIKEEFKKIDLRLMGKNIIA